MPDYKLSKIYAIRSHQTDQIYIGSTTNSLSKRMAQHNYDFKKTHISSCELMKYEDAYIELIELFPCNTREELNKKEGEHIRANNCVNKKIAGRIEKEWRETVKHIKKDYDKQYAEINKDKLKEYRKINKDRINQTQRERRLRKKLTYVSPSPSTP